MRPSRIFVRVIGLWVLLAIAVAVTRGMVTDETATYLTSAWWLLGVLLALAAFWDSFARLGVGRIEVIRQLPGSFSLGASNEVQLQISNPFSSAITVTVFDHYPPEVKVDAFPVVVTIPANAHSEIRYHALPIRRGDVVFDRTELYVTSPWRLWRFFTRRGEASTVKIYPNFAAISTLLNLQHEQQINQLGIHVQQRRGEGINFHQLREYRQGDTLSQIDWKATARHVKLISREYEDEKDQDIIFLLDCGRRMRTLDGDLSHFDHALNALLLTGYIALKQGDSVGLLSFAGESRWIPPIKGPSAINELLNQVYDLHSTTNASDLVQAAEHMLTRHRKRALVIIISNIREEDHDDLLIATRTLARRHLVMVASLREQFLTDTAMVPVTNFKTALRYSGVTQFIDQRSRVLSAILGRGVVVVDSVARRLHSDLANHYLQLKRAGRI